MDLNMLKLGLMLIILIWSIYSGITYMARRSDNKGALRDLRRTASRAAHDGRRAGLGTALPVRSGQAEEAGAADQRRRLSAARRFRAPRHRGQPGRQHHARHAGRCRCGAALRRAQLSGREQPCRSGAHREIRHRGGLERRVRPGWRARARAAPAEAGPAVEQRPDGRPAERRRPGGRPARGGRGAAHGRAAGPGRARAGRRHAGRDPGAARRDAGRSGRASGARFRLLGVGAVGPGLPVPGAGGRGGACRSPPARARWPCWPCG